MEFGPIQDAPNLLPVVADAGFDSEGNYAGATNLGVGQAVIAWNRRRFRDRLPLSP